MSSISYSHSETFSSLKSVDEKVAENLTSYQYLTILDELIYNSVSPILESTTFFEIFLSQIIGWQTLNPKRKTCGVGRQQLVSLFTLLLLSHDHKRKMKLLRRMKLHRNILMEGIRRWTKLLDQYVALSSSVGTQDVLEQLQELNCKALMRTGFSLHSTFTEATYWYNQSEKFKEQILEKYTRLIAKTAQRDYVDLKHSVPLDDLLQIYMVTGSKAIDKCDADRGVLTTYIQSWLKSAKNVAQSMNSQDTLQSLKYSDRSILTMEISHSELEEMSRESTHEEKLERSDTIRRVRTIAKLFDPSGTGRILLEIGEELSAKDRQTLRAVAVV